MIGKIISKVERYNAIRRYEKQEARINKYLSIKNVPNEVSAKLYNARIGIADFAKERNLKISITSANPDFLNVHVKHPDGSGSSVNVSSDVAKIFTYNEKPKRVLVEIPSDGTQIIRITQSSYEDNFLRHLYRVISTIAKK